MIAFFGTVSFHDGNGSCARTAEATHERITSAILVNFVFMAGSHRPPTSISRESRWRGGTLSSFGFVRDNYIVEATSGDDCLNVPPSAYHQNARGPHAPYHPQAASAWICAAI